MSEEDFILEGQGEGSNYTTTKPRTSEYCFIVSYMALVPNFWKRYQSGKSTDIDLFELLRRDFNKPESENILFECSYPSEIGTPNYSRRGTRDVNRLIVSIHVCT